MSEMENLWLVTVPTERDTSAHIYSAVRSGLIASGQSCQVFPFEVPSLHHGTLDSLIALSDELTKVSNQVEGVVKKVERHYYEVQGGVDNSKIAPLKVQEKPIDAYLKKWSWDYARYQHQGKKLSELVSQITSMAAQVDEEMKKLLVSHSEKQQSLANWQRRKVVNLGTSDFEDFMTPEIHSRLELLDNEHLLTLMVSMNKNIEDDFLENYSTVAEPGDSTWGRDIACYGSPSDREKEKGSPVVPGSAKKVTETNDQVMYTITVLKGHSNPGFLDDESIFHIGSSVDYVEPLKQAFREKRITLRPYIPASTESADGDNGGGQIEIKGVEGNLQNAQKSVDASLQTIVRWASAHFGDTFSAFVHLKAISGFVESVLRYGVPVDFTAMFVCPPKADHDAKDSQSALTATILKIRPRLAEDGDGGYGYEAEEEEVEKEGLPYVCQPFAVPGAPPS